MPAKYTVAQAAAARDEALAFLRAQGRPLAERQALGAEYARALATRNRRRGAAPDDKPLDDFVDRLKTEAQARETARENLRQETKGKKYS